MKILVTGSAGHLGEAIMRTLRSQTDPRVQKIECIGIDQKPSNFTDETGTIVDRSFVRRCMANVDAVLHTATLHKPHIATHSRQDFVDVNVTGTLNLLEEAVAAGVRSFVFTSTTSAFGGALTAPSESPATWIDEDVTPIPKNIYGATKLAAENLCQLFQREHQLPCLVLRTSRFFPEEDDRREVREDYDSDNSKANEFLFRRIDLEDVVSAHLLAMERATAIGFARYVVSATTPFEKEDCLELRSNAPAVVKRRVPEYVSEYTRRQWSMFPQIDRVYVNDRARSELGWEPRHNFGNVLDRLKMDGNLLSPLANAVGAKGYHATKFAEGPYPVEPS